MRPALSVILFTVLSGAGLGLFALLAFVHLAGWISAPGPTMHLIAGLLALTLVASGLISSTFHLANPKNAWRAVARFRTSWLSREGLLALVFFPIALGYLAAVALELPGAWQTALGLAGIALAWAVLFSTGMIYACLKTIPQWHSRLVPAAYLANGHLSGGLILATLAAADGRHTGGYVVLALIAAAVAGAIKWSYYRALGTTRSSTHSLSSAVGMTAAQAKLLDVGHTHGTFLTREFMFQFGRERGRLLRALFFLLSVLAPAIILMWGPADTRIFGMTALVCLAGLLIERWLFFAEAQHVVRLFHGQQTV